MNKLPVQRIAFYTKKVAELVKHPIADPLPRKYTYRNQRLQQYKQIMNEQLIELKKSW
ncbi:conserved hypothetical protein [Bacillus sp. 349Y]|nr:conserved hypothetical protein [Bacillus sp. 349Y]